MLKVKVGVFDSGVGGLSVVNAIAKEHPELEIVYKDDASHVPYGSRSVEEIHGFVSPILQEFVNEGCRVVVIACNTVTTNLIEELRREVEIPLIGMEPMIKPAAKNTKTGTIAVCATPRTLSSRRYAWLKSEFAKDVKVLEPDCSNWTAMIENNNVDRDKIAKIINDVCNQNADQIVLGCTHYHWIEDLVKELSKGRAEVVQPESAIINQLESVIADLKK